MNFNNLTPVEQYDNLYLKREDLFAPLGENNINGTKLRQCLALIEHNKDNINGIVTGCGISSPQSAIVSYVANYYNLPCTILVGGTTEERIKSLPYLQLSSGFNASIINCKSGRHTVLYKKARDIAKADNYFIVEYGINLENNYAALINSVANQVKNIPDNLDKLFITCGSGITSTGILLGIYLFKKNIKQVVLIGNAPNRVEFINKNLNQLSIVLKDEKIKSLPYEYHDVYNDVKGFKYEKQESAYIHDIKLHPNYEAKAWNYIVKNNLYKEEEKTMFWIIGGYIK